MKTVLIQVGKTVNKHFIAGINDYYLCELERGGKHASIDILFKMGTGITHRKLRFVHLSGIPYRNLYQVGSFPQRYSKVWINV